MSGPDPGRDRSIELVSANNGAVIAFGGTLTILPSRTLMIPTPTTRFTHSVYLDF
jgi:hypothetical protein